MCIYIVKHPQFIHLLSGAGRTCPDPISYHAAACPSRGGQWRGLVSHSGVKAEVLLGATVGESANSNWSGAAWLVESRGDQRRCDLG